MTSEMTFTEIIFQFEGKTKEMGFCFSDFFSFLVSNFLLGESISSQTLDFQPFQSSIPRRS